MNKLLSLLGVIAGLVISQASFGASLVNTTAAQFDLNRGNGYQKHRVGRALYKQRVFAQKCVYDFAVSGGAVSTISLKDEDGKNCVLPNKAIVFRVLLDEVTAITSGGSATISVSTGQTAADVLALTAYASFVGHTAPLTIQDGVATNALKMTADRTPSIAIAVAALTAGKLNVHYQYVISE